MYMDHDRSNSGLFLGKSHTNKVNIDKLEIVAPNVQGAGWDLTARVMQKRSQKKKSSQNQSQSQTK